MNILVIASNREQSPYPVAPLGVLCITASLSNAGHSIKLLDLFFQKHTTKAILNALKSFDCQAVAIGIRNLDNCDYIQSVCYYKQIEDLIRKIRSINNVPIVLGGSGFSVSPYEWMRRLKADYGVFGEGERSSVELFNHLENKTSPHDVPGVLILDHASKNISYNPPTIESNINAFITSSHDLCDYSMYIRKGGFVSIQTKRGCPYKCVYCIYPYLEGSRYRLRSPASIVEEIRVVSQSISKRDVFFTDSVFNTPRSHTLEVCRAISSANLNLRWMAFVNPVDFDKEMALTMRDSGCVGLEFGLDSATDKMIKILNKPFNQHNIERAFQACRDADLPFAVHLLFGGIGETPEDIIQTQNFLNTCATPNAVFASLGLRIYKNTTLEQIAKREEVIAKDDDLFEPRFYVSPALGDDPLKTLDHIARRRPEWLTPADWNSTLLRAVRAIVNKSGVLPQWKNVSIYGKYMRRKSRN